MERINYYLSPDNIAEIKNRLLNEMLRRLNNQRSNGQRMYFYIDIDELDGRLSEKPVNIQAFEELHFWSRETLVIKSISKALRRIVEGSYGRCLSCDEFIYFERLRIFPALLLCLKCQFEDELQCKFIARRIM